MLYRVLVLNTPYTHAYGLKLVSQCLSIQAELCHVRALIVKDADSLAHAEGSRRPFQFEVIRLGSLYSPGTSHVLDVWAGINEGGKGGRAVANVYLPLKITSRDPEDTEGALIPFSPRPHEPVVHLDSVTLDLYHEDQDQKAFESWTRGAVTGTLSLVAYSWGFWGNLSRAGSEADDLPTVDIIELSIEMAKSSVEAVSIAGAVRCRSAVHHLFRTFSAVCICHPRELGLRLHHLSRVTGSLKAFNSGCSSHLGSPERSLHNCIR